MDKAVLTLSGNKQFTITVKNNSKKNKYIQRVTLNNQPYNKTYIDHADLLRGGSLEFVMGPTPNKQWGTDPAGWP